MKKQFVSNGKAVRMRCFMNFVNVHYGYFESVKDYLIGYLCEMIGCCNEVHIKEFAKDGSSATFESVDGHLIEITQSEVDTVKQWIKGVKK